MGNFKSRTEMGNAMGEISAVLFELRDTLVELSQALRDLQFETDVEQRKSIEQSVQQLLQKIASSQNPSA
jgi:hypothetical protein